MGEGCCVRRFVRPSLGWGFILSLSLAAHAGHMRVLQARCAYVGLAHGAAVAEAARQGAPADAHAAMWPGPEPLGIDGRGSGG